MGHEAPTDRRNALPGGYASGVPTGKSGSAGLFWSGEAFLNDPSIEKIIKFHDWQMRNPKLALGKHRARVRWDFLKVMLLQPPPNVSV